MASLKRFLFALLEKWKGATWLAFSSLKGVSHPLAEEHGRCI